jgi:hypothetical protein
VDPISTGQVTSIVAGINAGKGLPGGGATFNWPTIAGVPIAFNAAQFENLGDAMMNYLYAFNQSLGTIIAGGAATFPALPLTIP